MYEMRSKFLDGVDGDIIVVYVDDLFVRLALDGLVPLIIHFRVGLISVSSQIIFYCRHFSFQTLMPNRIHRRRRRRLNLHELVMHAMIPFFR